MLAASLGGCAAAPKPLAFTDSEAFHERSSSIYGFVNRDLDGDGFDETVAMRRVPPGYTPVLYWQRPSEQGMVFEEGCTGQLIPGEELRTLRWLESPPWLFVVASEENPEERIETVSLVDLLQGCVGRYGGRIRIPKSDAAVVEPPGLRSGASLPVGSGALRIVDEPQFLRLEGAMGEVWFLKQVRQRHVDFDGDAVQERADEVSLLGRADVQAAWHVTDGEPVDLAMLTDGRDDTSFALRAGQTGALHLQSSLPILLFELHHGCAGEARASLSLEPVGGGGVYTTGEALSAEAFVRARGRERQGEGGSARELLALREPVAPLALRLGPATKRRCLREVRAYGWRDASLAPSGSDHPD